MTGPLDHVPEVPSLGRRQLVLVDGRTFAIADEAGDIHAPTHGMVHDDLRHLSRLTVGLVAVPLELLASKATTPFSAVTVSRARASSGEGFGAPIVTRRRWIAGGLREDIHLSNTSDHEQRVMLRIEVGADFANVFDMKAGRHGVAGSLVEDDGGWRIDAADETASTRLRTIPHVDVVDRSTGALGFDLRIAARDERVVSFTAEPVVDEQTPGLAFAIGTEPAEAIPMRRLASWRTRVPQVVSTDPRLAPVVDQALADIASLRIVDTGHVERAVVAAGAPWFMTLFGRDSLLTAWMALPFDPTLAVGVLATLADLQADRYDRLAEAQPGKILHELRRHGGGGPFDRRQRYYGTVDATPLFVMLAAEAWRWGALHDHDLRLLAPAVDAAVSWILGDGDSNGDGFVDYRRSDPSGLSNQGWKDSWDGITFRDGSLPEGPIALAEVQGYVYAALLGAAELSAPMGLSHDADGLVEHATRLRRRFNERFWDDHGWFAVGLDGRGRRIDSLTTNPGHALWTGITDPELADVYLARLAEPEMWTGWGLRTLAETMSAYDPLSYHNGSVWPHDTAICAAGAARYGRWDLVDAIVDGAIDAATEFDGRPPELFAGIHRSEAPMPISYPSSCSPQAWSSASVLLLIRTVVDLAADNGQLIPRRTNLAGRADLTISRIRCADKTYTLHVVDGAASVHPDAPVNAGADLEPTIPGSARG
jgi:glycogen debranching enzyme